MSVIELLNRPMLEADVQRTEASPWANKLRALSGDYRRQFLPVMNGSFAYMNLLEGPDQVLTCNPYRLWEYTSLFLLHDEHRPWKRALDVGGAASPFPYLLAESGITSHAVDLQPLLVAVCNHVASMRRIPLTASVTDITADSWEGSRFDLVTFISVLEHIEVSQRPRIFEAIHRLLEPDGLLYLTFDYGTYYERDAYQYGSGVHTSISISDLNELCAMIEAAGFEITGNDPRQLAPDILALRRAPSADDVLRRFAMTVSFDAATPWKDVAKYVIKRMIPIRRRNVTRFDQHNYFRMFLRRKR